MNSCDHSSSLTASVHPTQQTPEISTYIRFLIPNAKAEFINQKEGSTITEFQSQSGAHIQLSGNEIFFPGTLDRIIMIQGSLDVVVNATQLMLKKLNELQDQAEEGTGTDAKSRLRVIIPNRSCDAIIGKSGSTINAFQEDSHAGIQISELDNLAIGECDRLLSISGTLEEQMRAIFLVISKLSKDIHYSKMVSNPLSYSATTTGQYDPDRSYSITIDVADEHIKAALGEETITKISYATGATIKIPDRDDFMAGTSDRKVTLTGGVKEVQVAQMIIESVVAISEKHPEENISINFWP